MEVQEEMFRFITRKLHRVVHQLRQLTIVIMTLMHHLHIIQRNHQLIIQDNLQHLIKMLSNHQLWVTDNLWAKLSQFINQIKVLTLLMDSQLFHNQV